MVGIRLASPNDDVAPNDDGNFIKIERSLEI